MHAEPKSKSRWSIEKQQAYDRLHADLVKRIDELDSEKGDAALVLRFNIHKGGFQSGRFDADKEYA